MSMNNIKIDYHIPLTGGGVFTSVTPAFNRGMLVSLSRCLKASSLDVAVMIVYE